MTRTSNAGKNHNIKTANKLFENVAKLKYLVTALGGKEIKSRINQRIPTTPFGTEFCFPVCYILVEI